MARRLIDRCITATLIAALLAPLLTLGCSSGGRSGGDDTSPIVGLFESTFPDSPSTVARRAFNVYDADERRRSVNELASAPFGGQPPYLKLYRLLLDDPDPTVRAACLRALGKHGEPADVARVVPYMNDRTDFVRVEAATALQRLHHEDAVEPLIRALQNDEHADVRVAAASALAQYPQQRVFQALIGALADREYAVINQSVRSLRTLTGQDYGEDGSKWLAWGEQTGAMFADQKPYYYPQFIAPPTFFDRLQVWRRPKEVVPTEPTGLARDGSPDSPDSPDTPEPLTPGQVPDGNGE